MKGRLVGLVLAGGAILGCMGPTGSDGTGNDSAGSEYQMGVALGCDPDADAFDDIVGFAAAVEPQPDEVIAFWYGSTRVDLVYDAPEDVWWAEEWADDLQTDCDEVGTAWANFSAYADGEEVASGSADMEMLR
jgi:hypothetical protein